jgi:hypothetical protein
MHVFNYSQRSVDYEIYKMSTFDLKISRNRLYAYFSLHPTVQQYFDQTVPIFFIHCVTVT